MELTLKGILENIYRSKEYSNTKTGVITPPKWSFQFKEERQTDQGVQLLLHKVNVPDNVANAYKDKVGDLISIPVKVWVMNGKVGYTGV